MTNDEPPPTLHLPARDIPVPEGLSAAARAVLAMDMMETVPYPAIDDGDAWRAMVESRDVVVADIIAGHAAKVAATVEEVTVDGATAYVVTPEGTRPDDRRVYLDLHGGGLIQGGGAICRATGVLSAAQVGATTWALDYRMPPDHPYPAALDDCLAAYRALLEDHRPENIIVGGGSAGANLAAATVLRARDEGLPLPAAVALLTPELDLTESGDSFRTNLGLDNVLRESLMPVNLLYAAGHDLAEPYLSPLFGDFTRGFPPTIISTGTRDMFLSNAARMHASLRAADVPAELHVMEGAPHGGFLGMAPEDAALAREVRRFLDAHWR